MSQSENVSTKSSGSLKLLCPCGFSKQIPSKFDGKKVVCPKCRNVLSVTKVKRALLVLQCPYCRKAQRFDIGADCCRSCEKSFKPPKLIEELERKAAANDSVASPIEAMGAMEALGDEAPSSDSLLDVGAQPRVAVVSARKKPRKRSAVWQVLMAIFYIGGSAIVAWVVAGDKLGLPSFGEVTGLSPKASSPVVPVDVEENSAGDSSEGDSPALLSPSVEIVGGQFVVDQVLDQKTSKVVGSKTMVDLQVKNLTRLKIENIAFKLDCKQLDGETETFNIDQVNFSQGLMAEATGVLSLLCEPGDWETLSLIHI